MVVESPLRIELIIAIFTGEWLLAGVSSHMFGQISLLGEPGRTKLASEWLLPGMGANVFS